jgi:enamine deaminase RidA (YjgF/YER057c/UK114 family)
LLGYPCGAQNRFREGLVTNRFVNPNTMPAPRGYTQAVETSAPGRTIYLSGQLGMTPAGAFAGAPGDFRAQATQCFENLKAGLAAVGAGFEHVVKITNFFVDMDHLPVFFEVRDRYVNTKAPPASTAIQIGRLAREGALFEVEAVAVVPDKGSRPAAKSRGAAKRSGARKAAAKKVARGKKVARAKKTRGKTRRR